MWMAANNGSDGKRLYSVRTLLVWFWIKMSLLRKETVTDLTRTKHKAQNNSDLNAYYRISVLCWTFLILKSSGEQDITQIRKIRQISCSCSQTCTKNKISLNVPVFPDVASCDLAEVY